MEGRTLSHDMVLEKLGGGGMGQFYRLSTGQGTEPVCGP